ncbi:hypothetical protein [Paracoccus mutanolyticus]|uniref:hypothetical protein n=1 Tax=Paracoccus mutanolyticus TaxID=1499308 RepID=UPI0011AE1A94|nr:hypothetical protein [Paracoccus mutanolyticus]
MIALPGPLPAALTRHPALIAPARMNRRNAEAACATCRRSCQQPRGLRPADHAPEQLHVLARDLDWWLGRRLHGILGKTTP